MSENRRGRPLTGDEPRAHRVQVMLTASELEAVDRARGRTPRSQWIAEACAQRLERGE